jgi:hypothetical protein
MSQPPFVPPADALETVPRDLRFHPCGVEHPRTLTAGQVEEFNRDGYLMASASSTARKSRNRRYFDDLLARTLAEGRDSYRSAPPIYATAASTIYTHPRIVACVKDSSATT